LTMWVTAPAAGAAVGWGVNDGATARVEVGSGVSEGVGEPVTVAGVEGVGVTVSGALGLRVGGGVLVGVIAEWVGESAAVGPTSIVGSIVGVGVGIGDGSGIGQVSRTRKTWYSRSM
jgi:hypothetical protein